MTNWTDSPRSPASLPHANIAALGTSPGTVLFLAVNGPLDFTRHVHGFYRRMRVFADGLTRRGYRIQFVFFPRLQLVDARIESARVSRDMQRYWGLSAHVDLCPTGGSVAPQARTYWRQYGAPMFSAALNPEFNEVIGAAQFDAIRRSLDRGPTAVFAMGLETMLALDRLQTPLPPVYYDIDDIEHVQFRRSIGTVHSAMRRMLLRLEVPALVRAERRALTLARTAFVCSDSDRNYLVRRFGAVNVEVVPNTTAIPEDPVRKRGSLVMLFVGFLGYQPNRDAVELLCSEIWPRLHARLPAARLEIVGDKAETHPRHAAPPKGVSFLGFVDDLPARYLNADVVCCPITTGGGTRVKLVEAAGYASAMVSTRIGAEGLDLIDGEHALIRDEASGFANACVELMQQPQLAQRLGESARALAIARFSRETAVARVAAIFGS